MKVEVFPEAQNLGSTIYDCMSYSVNTPGTVLALEAAVEDHFFTRATLDTIHRKTILIPWTAVSRVEVSE